MSKNPSLKELAREPTIRLVRIASTCPVCSRPTESECSHTECPNRRRVTAQPSVRPDYDNRDYYGE